MSLFSVTFLVLASTIGLSLYTLYKNQNLLDQLILHPFKMNRDNSYFRLITSGFLHADLSHLIFNMLSFYFFAIHLERIVGSLVFLIFYLAAIVIANLDSVSKNKNNPMYRSLGASGGVAAVIFSYIIFNPATTLYLFFAIPIPGPVFAVGYLLYSTYASKAMNDNINHDAHIWGSLTGIAFALIYDPSTISRMIEFVRGYFS
ncbi:rhomboid family intramembrane serine protease [Leptospira sp. GIMC2001]|uniref:rhomboid family intramembrane serine protease n=1 Tax=Leptospira sp. GIMC2001 TaxID=1513297 RepID=UPI00234A6AFF|nr:rhomboid family intramembrane serine protease [Leptospira sp. GIMC2001]WCL48435.1 rhomboid family intramembrane serine protease [Leptospira sp. GIMC2001]